MEPTEDVQEGATAARQQLRQLLPVGARGELAGGTRVAAVDGRGADVEIAEQHHGASAFSQSLDSEQQPLQTAGHSLWPKLPDL
jgi:hypothetical protein